MKVCVCNVTVQLAAQRYLCYTRLSVS